ncbi:hypothetical protein C6P46_003748 [Rhodotorula mucilaginosa]|uniref:Uncharacterized protein n=1 Tax=Rhodotorula mucilaginosa TaxID=5537 RepID=A0A9P6W3U7_RHOMI|nr:hypothetical protein C6P46_003748 [Rhodotorula mucilaginosa]TKA52689.1 hypothetical protein B0A53_04142 [Rhodotorula sp. CCFEE 5036]
MASKAAQWQAQHEHYGPAGYGLDEQGGPQAGPSSLAHHPPHLGQPYEAYGHAATPHESKRDKRRREMVDRVQRLNEDTIARRDRIFHDLSEIYARTADELLPPPVFPTSDLSIPVGQLPPSLPFTDPVIPDMHPIPYLFSLHRLSMERAHQQLAIRLFHAHQLASAKRLYDAEVERIEDEYEAATKGVVERLVDGVEERRKRLLEEKEGEGVTIDTFLETQRTHGTRRMRGNGRGGGGSSRPHASNGSNGAASPSESMLNGKDGPNSSAGGGGGGVGAVNGTLGGGGGGVDAAALGSLLGLSGIADPFNLAASLLPSSTALAGGSGSSLSALSGVGPTASLLLTGTLVGKRKPGGRTQPGLPPAHFLVQSGTYSQFGKSLAGLSALRGEEVEGDLGEMRRKRQRVGGRRRVYE